MPVRRRAAALDEDLSIPFIPVDCFSFSPEAGPVVHFRIRGMPSLTEAFPEIREEPNFQGPDRDLRTLGLPLPGGFVRTWGFIRNSQAGTP